jgi:integrase
VYQECTKMATYQKRGDRWRAIIRKSGHRPVSKSFRTKALAKRWAQTTEDGIDSREFTDPRDIENITIGDLIDRYIEEFEPKPTKKGSLNIIKAGLGKYHLIELQPSDIVAHCRKRRREGAVSPATQSQYVGYLGQVLRIARNYWKIPCNADPVADARVILSMSHNGQRPLIGRPVERDRRPKKAELDKLRKYWNDNDRQLIPMSDIMDFAVASAWRLGEITRVTWADLNKRHKTIIIRDRKDPRNKYGNDQEVPLLGDAWTILQRQPEVADCVFPYNERSVSTAFTRACKKQGINNRHFHDLRHEGTSRLFEAGYQIPEVSLCTGHKDWAMLKRYTQLKAVVRNIPVVEATLTVAQALRELTAVIAMADRDVTLAKAVRELTQTVSALMAGKDETVKTVSFARNAQGAISSAKIKS